MTSIEHKSDFVETSDSVRLSYSRSGPATRTLVFIPGWRQTAAQWRKQVEHFNKNYDVITFDQRGHGESDKPAFGLRIARLAADLNDLLTSLALDNVTLIGHSMGCSVIWAFWDLYPNMHGKLSKVILVDQSPRMTADLTWTPEEAANCGAIFLPDRCQEIARNLDVAAEGLIRAMFTSEVAEEDFRWVMKQNAKMSAQDAGTLFLDHAANDWSDVLPRINIPTLCIGAKGSLLPAQSMELVSQKIPGSTIVTFEAQEGGSHFMFWQNPNKFNEVVAKFLTGGQ
ncbi:hypothetical protein NQ176_g2740 [Zarea fungicola]|uniref:Uncharacterized protein n=1 Tax=Zarea fungicola TaxID=93591 RepID=A0ACC1NMY3_9HYPO|nr:hypothetical protein NQ176_g2740 [Lecanicillium fungicola]